MSILLCCFYHKLSFKRSVIGCSKMSEGVLHQVSSSQVQLQDRNRGVQGVSKKLLRPRQTHFMKNMMTFLQLQNSFALRNCGAKYLQPHTGCRAYKPRYLHHTCQDVKDSNFTNQRENERVAAENGGCLLVVL